MFIISIINGQSDQARSCELVPGGHLHSSAPWASGPPDAWPTAMSIVTWETTRISSRTFSNGATQSDVKSLVIKFTFFKIASSISRTTVARTKIVSMFDNSLGQENMILLILFFFLSGVKWNQGFNDHWFYSLIISDLRNCSLEGGYEVLGSVLQPELFADKNATSLQSIIFRWEYYQDEYFSLRARPVLHARHSLCLGLCVVESHAVPCTENSVDCLFVPVLKKWKSCSPIMITSESRRASPLSLRAVKLWLSDQFSTFVFLDHPYYWGHIPTWKKVRLPPYAPSLFPKNCRGRDQ